MEGKKPLASAAVTPGDLPALQAQANAKALETLLKLMDAASLTVKLEAARAVLELMRVPLAAEIPVPLEPEASTTPDGPQSPHWLWLGGVRYRIGRGRAKMSWALLDIFWLQDVAGYDDLQGAGRPWPDPVEDATIATAVTRFNNEMPLGFPWKLRTKNRHITKEFPENPAK
jgi:hypothetical protein